MFMGVYMAFFGFKKAWLDWFFYLQDRVALAKFSPIVDSWLDYRPSRGLASREVKEGIMM